MYAIVFLFVKLVIREISSKAFVMREIARNKRVKRNSDPPFATRIFRIF